jgi:hypothetical protein
LPVRDRYDAHKAMEHQFTASTALPAMQCSAARVGRVPAAHRPAPWRACGWSQGQRGTASSLMPMAPTDLAIPTVEGRLGDVKQSAHPWGSKAGPYSTARQRVARRTASRTHKARSARPGWEFRRKSDTSLGAGMPASCHGSGPHQRRRLPTTTGAGTRLEHPALPTVARQTFLDSSATRPAATLGTQTKPSTSLTVAVLPVAGMRSETAMRWRRMGAAAILVHHR